MLGFFNKNNVSAACVLIVKDNLILAVETHQRPGEISLPCGFVGMCESPYAAAKRETLEETSLDVELESEELYSGRTSEDGSLVVAFKAKSFTGEPVACDDASSVKWVTKEELLNTKNRYHGYNRKVLEAAGM